MKVWDQQSNRTLPPLATAAICHRLVAALVLLGIALLAGCSNQPARTETRRNGNTDPSLPTVPHLQILANTLQAKDFMADGVAIITPSSITGQEEDKQVLALAFTATLQEIRPDLRVLSLPETLSAINRAGLTNEYKRMFEDYRLTGIFERETLQKVARVTSSRYLVQLKLAAFRQESKGRWGLLGIRMMETKSSTIRLFLQIWDSKDGSIAWEGFQESTLSRDSFGEEYVSLKSMVEASAHDLIGHFP